MSPRYLAGPSGWVQTSTGGGSAPSSGGTGTGGSNSSGSSTPDPGTQAGRDWLGQRYGTYYPDLTQVGPLPGLPLQVRTSVTVQAGDKLYGLDIQNLITPPSTTATNPTPIEVRNCIVRGTTVAPTGDVGMIRGYAQTHVPIVCYDTLLEPQTPHKYNNGALGNNYTLHRCLLRRGVDGCEVYDTGTGRQSGPSGVKIYGSWISEHAWFPPSIETRAADGSHPDGVQVEGCSGTVIYGNTIICQLAHDFQPNYYGTTQGNAALMIKPDVGQISGLDIRKNLLGGGAVMVNVAHSSKYRLGNIGTIADNAFLRDQRTADVFLLPSDVTGTFTGNHFYDNNAPVPIKRTNN